MLQNDVLRLEQYIKFLETLIEEMMNNLYHMTNQTQSYYLVWKDDVYKKVEMSFLSIEAVMKDLVEEIEEKNNILRDMKKKMEIYLGGK